MLTALIVTAAATLTVPPPEKLAPADILERAARAQHADAVATDLRDFSVRLSLQRREKESRVELDIERRFKAPDRIWTRVEEKALSGSVQLQGFDGETAWSHDEERRETVLLVGPEFRGDRKQIETDLKTMRQLLRFFFLRNLIPELEGLERLPDQSDIERGMFSMVVRGHGRLPETDGKDCVVTLWVEKETFRLLGARLEVDENAPLQFCFWSHARNAQGIVVPGSTQIYRNDEELPSESIYIAIVVDEDGVERNDMRFNTGLTDDAFRPPTGG